MFFYWGGGGGGKLPSVMCPMRGSEGVGGGIPPLMVGTFSKIRVSKSNYRALKNDFLGN